MLTREQVAGCRATIKNEPKPERRWRESVFVAALDSIDFLESRIAKLEAALAAAAVKVPVEVVDAAKRLQSWTESYDMRLLAKHPYADIKTRERGVLTVCNFILQLAGKDGENAAV